MTCARPLVLLVDDEAHILYVVGTKLREKGYGVLTAPNGEEGLALALAHKPDLVITDYQMPYITGVELCQRLREQEPTRDIPVLMLTARGFNLPKGVLQNGINAIISKPFSPREVLAKVKELLGPTNNHSMNDVA